MTTYMYIMFEDDLQNQDSAVLPVHMYVRGGLKLYVSYFKNHNLNWKTGNMEG